MDIKRLIPLVLIFSAFFMYNCDPDLDKPDYNLIIKRQAAYFSEKDTIELFRYPNSVKNNNEIVKLGGYYIKNFVFEDWYNDVINSYDSIAITEYATGKTKVWRKNDVFTPNERHLYNPDSWVKKDKYNWEFTITKEDID